MGVQFKNLGAAPFNPGLRWKCEYCRNKSQSHCDKCANCGAPRPNKEKDK